MAKNKKSMIVTATYRGHDPFQAQLSTMFHQAMNNLAHKFGVSTSGLSRTEQRNKEVNGVANSRHLYRYGTGRDFSLNGNWTALKAAAKSMGIRTLVHNAGSGDHLHIELPPHLSPRLLKRLSALAGGDIDVDVKALNRANRALAKNNKSNKNNNNKAAKHHGHDHDDNDNDNALASNVKTKSSSKTSKKSSPNNSNEITEGLVARSPSNLPSPAPRNLSAKKAQAFIIGDNTLSSLAGVDSKKVSRQFSDERLTPSETEEMLNQFVKSKAPKNARILLATGLDNDARDLASVTRQMETLRKAGYTNVEVQGLGSFAANTPRGRAINESLQAMAALNGFSTNISSSYGNSPAANVDGVAPEAVASYRKNNPFISASEVTTGLNAYRDGQAPQTTRNDNALTA